MSERWKNIPGYEYQISDRGRLWHSRFQRFLTPRKVSDGYIGYTLARKGVNRQVLAHRLVLEAFDGPCPEGYQGCHKNGDPSDNRIENLYWGTPRDNGADATRHGRTRARAAKLTEDQVRIIRGKYGDTPARDLAERFGVTVPNIHYIGKRQMWKHVA